MCHAVVTKDQLNMLRLKNGHVCYIQVRMEALQKLGNIVNENKLVTNNLGELPPVLAQRLVDSNSKIAAAAIDICQSLGNAMGVQCKVHVRTLFPGMLQGMGDSKVRPFIVLI
jgi:cytoskeleton-associated protein 5